MTARIVGILNGGPPTPDADYVLWWVLFLFDRVCPRCLKSIEVPLVTRAIETDAIELCARMNSGEEEDDIEGVHFEAGISCTATCHHCGCTCEVSSSDLDAEVKRRGEDLVMKRSEEFTRDLLEAYDVRRRQP